MRFSQLRLRLIDDFNVFLFRLLFYIDKLSILRNPVVIGLSSNESAVINIYSNSTKYLELN